MSRLPLALLALASSLSHATEVARHAEQAVSRFNAHVPPPRILNRKQRRAAKKQGRRR